MSGEQLGHRLNPDADVGVYKMCTTSRLRIDTVDCNRNCYPISSNIQRDRNNCITDWKGAKLIQTKRATETRDGLNRPYGSKILFQSLIEPMVILTQPRTERPASHANWRAEEELVDP